MMDGDLTPDATRLLILVSRFSGPAGSKQEEERWMKKLPLAAMVARGIMLRLFVDYDLAPSLVDYMGETRFAYISRESEDDIVDLRSHGLLERLKLATKHHYYVSAYRVTERGLAVAEGAKKEHHAAIDRLTSCTGCGGKVEIVVRPDAPYLVCSSCDGSERIPLLDIEEIPYVTSPEFPGIWLP